MKTKFWLNFWRLLTVMWGVSWCSDYQIALDYLKAGDSLQALNAFHRSLNEPNHPADALLYTAKLEKSMYKNEEAYYKGLSAYADISGNDSLLYETALYWEKREPAKALNYLRRLLISKTYSTTARQKIVAYFYSIGYKDSVLYHQARLKVKKSDSKPITKTLWSDLMEQGKWKEAASIYTNKGKNVKQAMNATLTALQEWEKGNKKLAYTSALVGEWSSSFPYTLYRIRLEALYHEHQYADFLSEAASYTKQIEADASMLVLRADAERETALNRQAKESFALCWSLGVRTFPNADAWAGLLAREQDWQKALEILKNHPSKSIQSYRLLTEIYISVDSLDAALKASKTVLSMGGTNQDWQNHGYIALRAGKESEAEKALLHALDSISPQIEILEMLEKVYESKTNQAKHEWVLEKKISLAPKEPEHLWRLGRLLSSNQKWDKAIPPLEEAHQANFAPTSVLPVLARCYIKTEKPVEAKNVLLELVTTYPDHRQGWRMLYDLGGEVLGAKTERNVLEKLLVLENQNLPLFRKYYELVASQGGKDSSYYVHLQRYYELAPSSGDVLKELVEWSQKRNDPELTLMYMEDWAKMSGDAVAWLNLAKHCRRMGDSTRAFQLLLEAHHRKPSESLAQFIYQLYITNNDSNAAFTFLSAHVGRQPQSTWSLHTLSRHLEVSQLSSALIIAQKAKQSCLYLKSSDDADVKVKQNIQLCEGGAVLYQYNKTALQLAVLRGEEKPLKLQGMLSGNESEKEVDPEVMLAVWSRDSLMYLEALQTLTDANTYRAIAYWEELGEVTALPTQFYRWYAWSRGGKWNSIVQESQSMGWASIDSMGKSALLLAWINTSNWEKIEAIHQHNAQSLLVQPLGSLALGLAYYHHKKWSDAEQIFATHSVPKVWQGDVAYIQMTIAASKNDAVSVQKLWADHRLDLQTRDSAYAMLGRIHQKNKQNHFAIEIWTDGLAVHPNSLVLLKELSRTHCELGETSACLRYGELYHQLGGMDKKIGMSMAGVYLSLNQPAEAERILTHYQSNDDGQLGMLFAQTHFALRNYDKTIMYGRKVIEKSKSDPEPYYLLAKAYEEQGQFEESQEYFHHYARLRNQSSK